MSRPHEDRERHTLVDHRPGGTPVQFAAGSWIAIGVARVKPDRVDACVSAYETLVEQARTSNVHAGPATVLAAVSGRRVITLAGLRGHAEFHHLIAAWDDHHRNAEHRVISESVSFTLYNVAGAFGASAVDPATHDAYIYENVERHVSRASSLFGSLTDEANFRGALVFAGDGATETVMLSRFTTVAAYDAFRAGSSAQNALGSPGEQDESVYAVHPRKTFAPALN